jgi:predicted transcriptional regulator
MSPFEKMRAQLVERGLIRKVDGEYRLTEQGNVHARQLTAQLASQARIEDRR